MIIDLFTFYMSTIAKLFGVMTNFVLFPGVNYFQFILGGFILTVFINFIYSKFKSVKSCSSSSSDNKEKH